MRGLDKRGQPTDGQSPDTGPTCVTFNYENHRLVHVALVVQPGRVVRNLALHLPFTTLVVMAVKSPGLASDSGIYNSSEEPTYWNTYKLCNVLYVNTAHYEHPPQTNTAIVSSMSPS